MYFNYTQLRVGRHADRWTER